MTAAAVLTPVAKAELLAAVRWIATDNIAAAKGFGDAVLHATRRLGRHPYIGVSRPALAPARYRFWRVPKYPYLIVYTDDTAPPRIVRIVHMARDLPEALAGLAG